MTCDEEFYNPVDINQTPLDESTSVVEKFFPSPFWQCCMADAREKNHNSKTWNLSLTNIGAINRFECLGVGLGKETVGGGVAEIGGVIFWGDGGVGGSAVDQ